ncbi:MAG: response regulator [Anaerolineae bacterium]|nr:response regulator [Anaerolineae bacterium]
MAQRRVLIIDDSPDTQKMLTEQVIEPLGYQPVVAWDGEEGLKLSLERKPHLIILDMRLPKMDGLDVLKKLQEQQPDVPVIFTTAFEATEMVVEAFRLGARDYVIKPIDPQKMQEAVQHVLSANRLREERDHLTRQLLSANEQLERQLQELNTIYTIGRAVTSLLDLDKVLNRVVEAAVYVANAEEGLLLLLDRRTGELYLRAAKNVDENVAHKLHLHVDDSIAGRAVNSDRPVLICGEETKIATGYLVRALLYLPLRVPGRGVIGVLGVANRESERSFSERDVFLLSALADYAAIAIQNAGLYETVEVERAKLEAILREAQEAVVVVDGSERILLCNAAAHVVLDLGDITLCGQPARSVLRIPVLGEMFADARETGQAIRREVPLESGKTFNAQLTPIEGVGYVLVMQDITHLKELDRIRSEFVATVSHDLRTPLTNILGYVELLPRAGPLNERQEEFILRVRESMESITELVGDLLDIGRIEAGFDLDMSPCNLVHVIDASIKAFHPRAREKRQDLRWEPPQTLPLVNGNARVLGQVVDNLVSNAIKYTQEGGWVAVSAEVENGHVVIRVSDNGMGIPPAHQPYIFDRFYRVESEETADIAGTGLGLAIVKTAIEKHNGRVWVESKPGAGSVFCFVLPSLPAQES